MVETASERPLGRTLLVGYGKLGRRVASLLSADAELLYALRRTAVDLPPGVEGITADVSYAIERLPSIDSMLVTLPPGDSRSSYRTALSNIAAALPSSPARTVFVSSTAVFEGAGPHRVLTEDDEPIAVSDRSHRLIEGERAAVDFFGATILRPAGIYGPGREFMLRRVRAQTPADHSRWTNRIHQDDLVSALAVLLRAQEAPSLLHAVDGHPAQLGEVLEYVATMLGLPVPHDEGTGLASGHILDGTRLRGWIGELQHPSYRSGYAEMNRPAE
ncbi:Rossmann-fold NAD(P)-binding domain-containing protein [Microbacterium sp. GXF0217]